MQRPPPTHPTRARACRAASAQGMPRAPPCRTRDRPRARTGAPAPARRAAPACRCRSTCRRTRRRSPPPRGRGRRGTRGGVRRAARGWARRRSAAATSAARARRRCGRSAGEHVVHRSDMCLRRPPAMTARTGRRAPRRARRSRRAHRGIGVDAGARAVRRPRSSAVSGRETKASAKHTEFGGVGGEGELTGDRVLVHANSGRAAVEGAERERAVSVADHHDVGCGGLAPGCTVEHERVRGIPRPQLRAPRSRGGGAARRGRGSRLQCDGCACGGEWDAAAAAAASHPVHRQPVTIAISFGALGNSAAASTSPVARSTADMVLFAESVT